MKATVMDQKYDALEHLVTGGMAKLQEDKYPEACRKKKERAYRAFVIGCTADAFNL